MHASWRWTLLAAMTLAACESAKTKAPVETAAKNDTTLSPSGVDAARRGKALVRFVDAVADDHHVALLADQQVLLADAAYKSVSPYHEVGDNTVRFTIRRTPGDSVLADNNELLVDGFRYTVVAMSGDDGKIITRVLRDEVVPDSGKARVRVIAAVRGGDVRDVRVSGDKDALFSSVMFGTESGPKDVPPRHGAVVVKYGPDPAHTLRLPSAEWKAGTSYSIVLVGGGGKKVEAVTFDDRAATP